MARVARSTINRKLTITIIATTETDRRAETLRETISTLSERSRQLEREIGGFRTE